MAANKFFVYGTLRPELDATHVLTGYSLHNYGKYPFILPDPEGMVYGNVLLVDDETVETLDYIENVRSRLFKRIKVKVVPLHKDKEVKVQVYVPDLIFANDPNTYPVIPSGDWYKR